MEKTKKDFRTIEEYHAYLQGRIDAFATALDLSKSESISLRNKKNDGGKQNDD